MPRRVNIDAYIRRLSALASLSKRDQAANADAVGKVMQDLTAEILRVLGVGTNGNGAAITSQAHADELLNEADRLFAEAQRALAQQYEKSFGTMWTATRQGLIEAVGDGFGLTDANRLRAAARVFEQDKLLTMYRSGFQAWRSEFAKIGGDLRGVISEKLTLAQLNGWDTNRVAREVVGSGRFFTKNLPELTERGKRIYTLGGKLPEADALVRRAQVIVRTETTKASQAAIETWSAEAGFDKYVNFNLEPVADECKRANALGPMTMAEWAASDVGVPPRHPNCDSRLVPWAEEVPEASAEEYEKAMAILESLPDNSL